MKSDLLLLLLLLFVLIKLFYNSSVCVCVLCMYRIEWSNVSDQKLLIQMNS